MDTPLPWLTQAEACRYARIGRTTLYRLCQRGVLRARKLGGRTLISRLELDALIDGQTAPNPTTKTGGVR
jgi:excisionase family DNA binding protein